MAWMRIDSELEGHPKLIRLSVLLGCDRDAAIGKLNRFWWWAQKYAEDGDLTRFLPGEVDASLAVPNFLQHAVSAGLIDTAPYLRVHDWWEYVGPWLIARYKKSPKKWMRVRRLYSEKSKRSSVEKVVTVTKQLPNSYVTAHERDVQDVTKSETTSRKTTLARAQANDTSKASPPEPSQNPENGHGAHSNGEEKNAPSPLDDRAEIEQFIQTHAPPYDQKFHPNFDDADKNGRSLESMTRTRGNPCVKACWVIFSQRHHNGYDEAKVRHFAIYEFLRQFDFLIDKNQRMYAGLKKNFEDESRRINFAEVGT